MFPPLSLPNLSLYRSSLVYYLWLPLTICIVLMPCDDNSSIKDHDMYISLSQHKYCNYSKLILYIQSPFLALVPKCSLVPPLHPSSSPSLSHLSSSLPSSLPPSLKTVPPLFLSLSLLICEHMQDQNTPQFQVYTYFFRVKMQTFYIISFAKVQTFHIYQHITLIIFYIISSKFT